MIEVGRNARGRAQQIAALRHDEAELNDELARLGAKAVALWRGTGKPSSVSLLRWSPAERWRKTTSMRYRS